MTEMAGRHDRAQHCKDYSRLLLAVNCEPLLPRQVQVGSAQSSGQWQELAWKAGQTWVRYQRMLAALLWSALQHIALRGLKRLSPP